MTQGETYRVKAAELHAQAKQDANPDTRAELERLAKSYLRLAEQADRNSQTNVVYETPPWRPVEQQQIHPKKNDK
jgi:hypothetical protein